MDSSLNDQTKTITCLTRIASTEESADMQLIKRIEPEMDSNAMTQSAMTWSPQCLQSGDNCDYSLIDVVNSKAISRSYTPSSESRQLHNQKERLRRLRIKYSCDALRQLVPGISEKTDKATVLEHSVNFLVHLSKCSGVKCDDYLPQIPPPVSAKLMEMYPNMSCGDNYYYETLSAEDQELIRLERQLNEYKKEHECSQNTSHIVELTESNGTQFVTTSDGLQYMIINSIQQTNAYDQQMDESAAHQIHTNVQDLQIVKIGTTQEMGVDCPEDNKSSEQLAMFLNKMSNDYTEGVIDNKENIDPKSKKESKCMTKRAGRKKKCFEQEFASIVNQNDGNSYDLMMDSISFSSDKPNQKRALKSKLSK